MRGILPIGPGTPSVALTPRVRATLQSLRRALTRAWSSACGTPRIRKRLSRLVAPLSKSTCDRFNPRASRSSSVSALFARPSSGGAVTATLSAPACSPWTPALRAPGWALTGRISPSALSVMAIMSDALLSVTPHLEQASQLVPVGRPDVDANGLGFDGHEVVPVEPLMVSFHPRQLDQRPVGGLAVGNRVVAHGLRLRRPDDAAVDGVLGGQRQLPLKAAVEGQLNLLDLLRPRPGQLDPRPVRRHGRGPAVDRLPRNVARHAVGDELRPRVLQGVRGLHARL